MPLNVGHCIFCGSKGNLSKEHIWSDWLGSELKNTGFFTRGLVDQLHTGGAFNNTKSANVEQGRGAIHKQKVRKVCVQCNNTWMSNAVNSAKQAALKLVRGECTELSIAEQSALSLWIALCAIAVDSRLPKICVLTQDQRDEVRIRQSPMANCIISIGRFSYSNEEEIVADRNYLRLSKSGPNEVCIYTLAYAIKNFFAHIIIVNGLPDAVRALRPINKRELAQIFPQTGQSVNVNSLPIIDYKCADRISRGPMIALQNGMIARGFKLRGV